MNLLDHIVEWLESIGAGGLMNDGPEMVELWTIEDIKRYDRPPSGSLVPAWR